MAVLTIEIFACAPDDLTPCLAERWMVQRLGGALAPLKDALDGPLPVLGFTVQPYAGGAMITLSCVAASGIEAVDMIAARLEAAMGDTPAVSQGWRRPPGKPRVLLSQNSPPGGGGGPAPAPPLQPGPSRTERSLLCLRS
ncbi:hypothetical protein LG943_12685 [Streptomonospora sp. S1-112]|uniref:Uncharacterized protein n=1 Tax=Streptomonospora mangrovi TaxID=2883123 RepID=A0A9X3NLG8_9ACTN|nr:hypothetical protein [Streptomonospora mangrovi]MDA0565165.1 hypothetical protein [Streptomonospora mangrovi]